MSASTSSTSSWRRSLARRAPFTVDAARFVSNPSWEIDIWRDVLRTRREASSFRALATDSSRRPALIALYRDNVFETKMSMVPATALRMAGIPVVGAIPDSRATRARRYLRLMGAESVVDREHLDRRLGADHLRERAEAVEEVASLAPEVQAVKHWTFDGHQAGMHILSSLIRLTFDGAPDLIGHAGLLRTVAEQTIREYQRSALLLDDVDPSLVLVQEANYSVNGPLVDLATSQGIDVIQTITTWRDDALMSKRLTAATRRVDAKSVDLSTLERLERDDPWSQRHEDQLDEDFARRYGGHWRLGAQFQPGTRDMSDEEIRTLLGVDPSKPTVVVFTHVLWDASLFFGVDLFDNYGHWLTETVRAAIANDRVNWVIKAHPANVFRQTHGDAGGEAAELVLLRRVAPDPPDHVKILMPNTPLSTLSLYRYADVGVTVRGTPGLEMACFGKPVLTAGTGAYSGLGFTVDSESQTQYLERLAVLPHEARPSVEACRLARRYAQALFLRRPWTPDGFELQVELPESGWHPLELNVRVTASPDDRYRRQAGTPTWAEWALRSRAVDHLV